MVDPSIPIAAFAGLVSFLSPCVLPLVPGYISYMSGISATEGEVRRPAKAALVALGFVLGFTAVFVALGASATLLGSFLRDRQDVFIRVGGVLIIVLGLVFMGAIKVPFLYREARFHPTPKAGMWGSVVLGAAFAFGWSPCIGATLGAVLTMAAGNGATGGPGEGALLLAFYSLGLGIPFVLAGLGVSRLAGAVRWLREHTRTLNLASGALLVAVGIMFMTGLMVEFSTWMQRLTGDLGFWSSI